MKKVLPVVIIALLAFVVYWFFIKADGGSGAPKQKALKAGVHSVEFNNSVDSLISGYLKIHAAFVDADTIKVKEYCIKMIQLTNSLKLEELKKDTSGIYASAVTQKDQVKESLASILVQTDLTIMRKDFQWLSESIYPLLKTIHYEGETLYLQSCPMAFGEDQAASWISNTPEIVNPYLGKNHSEYKGTMLHCGEIKDSIEAK